MKQASIKEKGIFEAPKFNIKVSLNTRENGTYSVKI